MKFRWRVFILCIGIYLAAIIITCIIITEGNYRRLTKNEVERYIKEEENIFNSLTLYLYANEKMNNEVTDIDDYSNIIVDMFGNNDTLIEVYDNLGRKLDSNVQWAWGFERNEIKDACKAGKNFILRWYRGKHYVFITDVVKVDGDSLIISVIKDITSIDAERKSQYLFFLKVELVGLVITAAAAFIFTRYMIRPIEKLGEAAGRIASGGYSERVQSKGKDEISQLGQQFNVMADEIQDKISQLRIESERKQRFIDNLTHELRTPLTSVIGYSDLLMNVDYDKEMLNKGLAYINSEGNRMLRMITRLMDMIIARQGNLRLESVNTRLFLEEVSEIVRLKAQGKNIEIKLLGKDMILDMDMDLMKEVVLNLVDNAINASDPGKSVIIGTQASGDSRHIYIKDEGRGMKKEDINRVFEPFYRVEKSRSKKEGGVGLGLSICSEIVSAHGGKLDIESNLNEGTTVYVIFMDK